MLRKIKALLAVIRPSQAYKVGIVWLPALFHGSGSLRANIKPLALASLAWWLASCIVYILNDLKDAPEDRLRPERSHRPIANGELTPRTAIAAATIAAGGLLFLLLRLPLPLAYMIGAYLALNLIYSLGLKSQMGLQQAIIAMGFWLRLKSGAAPIVDIPITPWAALFTLGLAYYLNCLKGLGRRDQPEQRPERFALGLGAGLAGSLALAALVAICLKRGVEGTMRWPELPPLFCLIGMHRAALGSFHPSGIKEQAMTFFSDPITLISMGAFVLLFITG